MEYQKMFYNAQMSQNQTLATLSQASAVESTYFPANEQYATYANNFDLSLLPQDNIPTTVFQYNSNNNSSSSSNNSSSSSCNSCDNNTELNTPEIKIEQTWCILADIKQEQASCYTPQSTLQQQSSLIPTPTAAATTRATATATLPPPAYPHIYPSPQSSPAQTEYSSTCSPAFAHAQFNGCYDSLSSSRTSLNASSPCPSLDVSCNIKQELHILPPSPPESNCETPSPRSTCNDNIKIEPFDADVETLIDLNSLLEKNYTKSETIAVPQQQQQQQQQPQQQPTQQDHQVLREYLEDNTFQKRHNLKPLALESFIGNLAEVRGDFEPVISLALEHAKREADAICQELHISRDPNAWSSSQVHAWLRSTIAQFKLPQNEPVEAKFCEDGAALMLLSEEEFMHRLPESGSTLHAQLEIWKMAYADGYQNQPPVVMCPQTESVQLQETNNPWQATNYMQNLQDMHDDSEDENNEQIMAPSPPPPSAAPSQNNLNATGSTQVSAKRVGGARNGGSHIHLWQFLKELLAAPHINGTAIRWIDRAKGIFKIEDSVRVAKLWGRRKNRPAMNYDKLSRSIRQYYKKGIMKKTERSQRLVYQFCHPYNQ